MQVIENLDSLDLDELDGPTLGAILRRQRATHGVRRITSVALEPYLRPSATEVGNVEGIDCMQGGFGHLILFFYVCQTHTRKPFTVQPFSD